MSRKSSSIVALAALLLAIYISSPVVFKYSPFIQRTLLFMNNFEFGETNLARPEEFGIKCARVLRLKNYEDNIELGVWHILPESTLSSCTTSHHDNRTSIQDDAQAFRLDSRPIVLYIHGNKGTRAGEHRSRLYRRLAYEHDYHVVTFDYRGYADSTYETPTAAGLTTDAWFMYQWLVEQPGVTKERVIVWGHSLGTAVAVRMVADLDPNQGPRRLILEAPFDSLSSAVANHPFSWPFRVTPYFQYFFVDPIRDSLDLNFDSDKRIGDIKWTPIMILHAQDDAIIPQKLGLNLYYVAVEKLGKSKVKFASISSSHGLGHKYICMHDETMLKVKQFIGT